MGNCLPSRLCPDFNLCPDINLQCRGNRCAIGCCNRSGSKSLTQDNDSPESSVRQQYDTRRYHGHADGRPPSPAEHESSIGSSGQPGPSSTDRPRPPPRHTQDSPIRPTERPPPPWQPPSPQPPVPSPPSPALHRPQQVLRPPSPSPSPPKAPQTCSMPPRHESPVADDNASVAQKEHRPSASSPAPPSSSSSKPPLPLRQDSISKAPEYGQRGPSTERPPPPPSPAVQPPRVPSSGAPPVADDTTEGGETVGAADVLPPARNGGEQGRRAT